MSQYAKLAIVIIRCFGTVMVLYAGPVILLGLLKLTLRGNRAADGVTTASATTGWAFYLLGGVLLLAFARPIGQWVARGLDASTLDSPAA